MLDENNSLYRNINKEMISMEDVELKPDQEELEALIREHTEKTGSEKEKRFWNSLTSIFPNLRRLSQRIIRNF